MRAEDAEKIARLAMHEGWEVLVREIKVWQDSHVRQLANSSFENLQAVGRLQGEITALQRVLDFVQRRAERIERGD